MFTQHAQQRMQQRGIDPRSVDFLLAYGKSEYHRGREVLFFDKEAQQRLAIDKRMTPQLLDKYRNCYLVLADGNIVTVGHRYCHFKRDRH